VAASLVGEKGKVIASDILPMDALPDVDFLCGDFSDESVFESLLAMLEGRPVDLVISDMAPNMSGIAAVDQPSSMYLCELALDFAKRTLRAEGNFVCKVFHGEGFDTFMLDVKGAFRQASARKPDASRSRSREVYLVAKGLKR